MKAVSRQTQGIVAAGILAILTVSVFAGAQYSGPESAVSRFHYGVATGNADTLRQVCLQSVQSPPAQNLIVQLDWLLKHSTDFRIIQVKRRGTESAVAVLYESPLAGTVIIEYFLQKPRGRWLIDVERTWGMVARAPIGGG
ncbi:MAG TPA: hypothetical protein VNI20_14295 [Fimbriimonadaceae bacterium]|nr:hypothetical protein [Fimbriimonadaceae bacterium]